MLLTPRTSRRCLRGMLPVALGLLLAAEPARAQEGVTRLTLEEAEGLATRANSTVRAKQFEYQAVGANEITGGLRPNPTASFLAEQFGGASSASQTRYTLAYRRGGINLLDFLEAQRAYRDTTSEYVRSLGGGWTSFYQLEAAGGGSLGEN